VWSTTYLVSGRCSKKFVDTPSCEKKSRHLNTHTSRTQKAAMSALDSPVLRSVNPELSWPSTGGSDALFDAPANLSENDAAGAVSCTPSPWCSPFAALAASDADFKEEEEEGANMMALLGVDAPKLSSRGVPMLPVHVELWTSFVTDDIDALVVLGRALLVLSVDHTAPTRYLVCACPDRTRRACVRRRSNRFVCTCVF